MFEKDRISYTTNEAVKATGINRYLLQKYRESGILKAVKCGRNYIYLKKDLEEMLERFKGCDLSNEHEIKKAVLTSRKQVSTISKKTTLF